jgi:protein-S-isoprenylcysteine O-methyltransferase Ste14
LGKRITLFEWLALEATRLGIMSFSFATPAVIVVSASIAAAGVIFRVWGAACLGPATVQNFAMKAGQVVADGPFRFVRNPLYLGLWFTIAAIAFLMPPSGALFTMTALTFFLMRLILAEEAFLAATLGEPYRAYLSAVPRLIPRLRAMPPSTNSKPHWLTAVLSEIMPIGVFISSAVLAWSYNTRLVGRGIIISFGVSLVVRAFVSQTSENKTGAA